VTHPRRRKTHSGHAVRPSTVLRAARGVRSALSSRARRAVVPMPCPSRPSDQSESLSPVGRRPWPFALSLPRSARYRTATRRTRSRRDRRRPPDVPSAPPSVVCVSHVLSRVSRLPFSRLQPCEPGRAGFVSRMSCPSGRPGRARASGAAGGAGGRGVRPAIEPATGVRTGPRRVALRGSSREM
jgi:hypothetical protein